MSYVRGPGSLSAEGEHLTHSRPRVLLSWSSGKDSAWTLHVLRQQGLDVVALLTTLNGAFDRVAMHAVRRQLLEAQAESVGLPLRTVHLPWPCSNEEYGGAFGAAIESAHDDLAITHIAFGDLFLEDVRAYREKQLAGTGLTPLFPIWGIPTDALAKEMVGSGLEAIITCVDPRQLDPAFAGRIFDATLLDQLPSSVDPCGERGEFHSFAYAGSMFSTPLAPVVGEIVERDGFVFADVTLDDDPGDSIFDEDGALTREYLLKRGSCCGHGCRNCPYGHEAVPTSRP
jgi:uncharacterized protein (TIGR00290 family)